MRRNAFSGFTIIELTVVLALVVIMMGLVVVRLNWGGPRQALIMEARKLGRLISTYRGKAIDEEHLYCLTLDLNEGRYSFAPSEDKFQTVKEGRPLKQSNLPPNIRFVADSRPNKILTSAVAIYFDAHGMMPETQIKLKNDQGTTVVIHPDPLCNEVTYDER
jgi:Tfp pilus assembly protein FimT